MVCGSLVVAFGIIILGPAPFLPIKLKPLQNAEGLLGACFFAFKFIKEIAADGIDLHVLEYWCLIVIGTSSAFVDTPGVSLAFNTVVNLIGPVIGGALIDKFGFRWTCVFFSSTILIIPIAETNPREYPFSMSRLNVDCRTSCKMSSLFANIVPPIAATMHTTSFIVSLSFRKTQEKMETNRAEDTASITDPSVKDI
ncbi:hypothetical protein GQR58_030272 [Nymphon striatum]|nr:hypothetical protein GQR58_030272 [Nymphon striatum]